MASFRAVIFCKKNLYKEERSGAKVYFQYFQFWKLQKKSHEKCSYSLSRSLYLTVCKFCWINIFHGDCSYWSAKLKRCLTNSHHATKSTFNHFPGHLQRIYYYPQVLIFIIYLFFTSHSCQLSRLFCFLKDIYSIKYEEV